MKNCMNNVITYALQQLTTAEQTTIKDIDAQRKLDSWRRWPFSSFGYKENFWFIAAKFLFVAVIFGLLISLLRYLFGPNGPLRGQEWKTVGYSKKPDNDM